MVYKTTDDPFFVAINGNAQHTIIRVEDMMDLFFGKKTPIPNSQDKFYPRLNITGGYKPKNNQELELFAKLLFPTFKGANLIVRKGLSFDTDKKLEIDNLPDATDPSSSLAVPLLALLFFAPYIPKANEITTSKNLVIPDLYANGDFTLIKSTNNNVSPYTNVASKTYNLDDDSTKNEIYTSFQNPNGTVSYRFDSIVDEILQNIFRFFATGIPTFANISWRQVQTSLINGVDPKAQNPADVDSAAIITVDFFQYLIDGLNEQQFENLIHNSVQYPPTLKLSWIGKAALFQFLLPDEFFDKNQKLLEETLKNYGSKTDNRYSAILEGFHESLIAMTNVPHEGQLKIRKTILTKKEYLDILGNRADEQAKITSLAILFRKYLFRAEEIFFEKGKLEARTREYPSPSVKITPLDQPIDILNSKDERYLNIVKELLSVISLSLNYAGYDSVNDKRLAEILTKPKGIEEQNLSNILKFFFDTYAGAEILQPFLSSQNFKQLEQVYRIDLKNVKINFIGVLSLISASIPENVSLSDFSYQKLVETPIVYNNSNSFLDDFFTNLQKLQTDAINEYQFLVPSNDKSHPLILDETGQTQNKNKADEDMLIKKNLLILLILVQTLKNNMGKEKMINLDILNALKSGIENLLDSQLDPTDEKPSIEFVNGVWMEDTNKPFMPLKEKMIQPKIYSSVLLLKLFKIILKLHLLLI